MGIAVITGASSGLGAEFARQLLGRKELEEIRQEGKTFPVECQFCDAVYSFTPEDIQKLLEKI